MILAIKHNFFNKITTLILLYCTFSQKSIIAV